MFQSKATINATAGANSGSDFADNDFYWSSSEFDLNKVWVQAHGDKNFPCRVRAVRAF